MNHRFSTWLAFRLLDIARALMPRSRAQWISAMHAEAAYLSDGKLRWAAGCLVVAIKQRTNAMQTGDLRISRAVMLIETIGCFGFLALGWFEITFGASGVIHHTPDVIRRFYLPYPGGTYLVSMIFAGTLTGLIGLIGLFLGIRYVVTGRALESRAVALGCLGVLLAYLVIGGIAGLLVGPPEFRPGFDMALLFSILPAAGIAHLHWLARHVPKQPALSA